MFILTTLSTCGPISRCSHSDDSLALFEKLFWYLTVNGEERASWAVFLGSSLIHITEPWASHFQTFRFGLLHRIPALPADRQPGAIPLELHDDVNEYEEQDLFVPADATGHDLHGTSRLNHDHDSFAIDYSGSRFGQDYSYTFSNRGVATQPSQNRHLASSTIQEEQEPAGVPVASASELSGPPRHAHRHSSSRQPVETMDTHMRRAPTPTSAPPSTNGNSALL